MDELFKKVVDKLRQPVHIDYISKNILHKDMDETIKYVTELTEQGVLIQSEYGKDYYTTKNGK
jgi:adenine C2-methylase RlmN of 23S rRNA A2503 and tRNA A37